MVIPDLFNEVSTNLINYWREKIEKADDLGYIKREREVEAQLNEKLDEETKKLAKLYRITVENSFEHTYFEICCRLFLFSIKSGMGMQKAFEEEI